MHQGHIGAAWQSRVDEVSMHWHSVGALYYWCSVGSAQGFSLRLLQRRIGAALPWCGTALVQYCVDTDTAWLGAVLVQCRICVEFLCPICAALRLRILGRSIAQLAQHFGVALAQRHDAAVLQYGRCGALQHRIIQCRALWHRTYAVLRCRIGTASHWCSISPHAGAAGQHCGVTTAQCHVGAQTCWRNIAALRWCNIMLVQHWCSAAYRCHSTASALGAVLQYYVVAVSSIVASHWCSIAASHWQTGMLLQHRADAAWQRRVGRFATTLRRCSRSEAACMALR